MHENRIKAAIILSLGLIVSSVAFALAFCYTRSTVPYVSVKGLSEREVDADLGIWTIKYEAIDSNLEQVNRQIKKQTEILVDFLREQGFVDKEIVYGAPEFHNLSKYDAMKLSQYSIAMEVVVHTPNISLLYETVQKSQELMKLGVCLTSNWKGPAKFIFTRLNEIKPSMIQEATINAKKAAEKFTADVDVRLGRLRKGSQGTFSIEDTHLPTKKLVRVVTQMEYAVQ